LYVPDDAVVVAALAHLAELIQEIDSGPWTTVAG